MYAAGCLLAGCGANKSIWRFPVDLEWSTVCLLFAITPFSSRSALECVLGVVCSLRRTKPKCVSPLISPNLSSDSEMVFS